MKRAAPCGTSSRTSKPFCSSASVSEAIITVSRPLLRRRPITIGRKPCGSRNAYNPPRGRQDGGEGAGHPLLDLGDGSKKQLLLVASGIEPPVVFDPQADHAEQGLAVTVRRQRLRSGLPSSVSICGTFVMWPLWARAMVVIGSKNGWALSMPPPP